MENKERASPPAHYSQAEYATLEDGELTLVLLRCIASKSQKGRTRNIWNAIKISQIAFTSCVFKDLRCNCDYQAAAAAAAGAVTSSKRGGKRE